MAAALLKAHAGSRMTVDSAGVYEGGHDPFVSGVLAEEGVAFDAADPKTLGDVDLETFDLIVVLTPEAAGEARRLAPGQSVEFWEVDNPTDVRGPDDVLLGAYRAVRDQLTERIKRRFSDIF